MLWKGYKTALQDTYENITVSQTVNMNDKWKEGHKPDKSSVKTKCPSCGQIAHPLMQPHTAELEHKRTKYKRSCRKFSKN